MISSLSFTNVATFNGSHELSGAKRVNYLFGGNGAGKSTIANLLADAASAKTWQGEPLEVMVYNKKFVEANFYASDDLDGVFTLGDHSVDLQQKIDAARVSCGKTGEDIAKLNSSLESKQGELQIKKEILSEACWAAKKRYETKFAQAFVGFVASKDKFGTKVIAESQTNSSAAESVATLEKKAQVLFLPVQPQPMARVTLPAFDGLVDSESEPLLRKKILGKGDVDISYLFSGTSANWRS